ncbi:iron-containing alcohol dehydrogenase [Lentimicrobium sp.]|uniref:iron-containing alcohol dehydrogenase n=1 Tax=Lentimicrobium sp. TaxID=2034841 RepID=UPI002CD01703|nr:iron-containing alcohol dehydrogenase [Lentimicrobium sp.]HPF63442.1 iron-containing alcohol dehydrogenase [Lentimicrobium sp.]HPR25975.1 iron-containing alcohol dehydrogenase [Lentimicrobium sp.]HRW68904.1 iron-containing alcohol dehydrogenase [Lentimicrobium sp.]
MARFTLPRDLYFGENALEELRNLKGTRAIIVVGGGSMKKFGFLNKVETYLQEAGMETLVFEGVEPDPSVETVMRGAEAMKRFNPDWIVSIGGGSPIDAAKAMWVFYEHPEATFEEIAKPFNIPVLRNKARFVAIPSTSGTATEVTAFSVITDYRTQIKYPLADFEITPDVAIVDPALAYTMPKELTAHTGMDALAHATEAYVAVNRSDFSDPLALKAIRMISDNLVKSYHGDKEARNKMHIAQCLAGMAFSNALLGIVHSMAHKSGAVFHIPHGCLNAIYLPVVIDYNRKVCADRYAEIARSIDLPGATAEELTDAFRDFCTGLNDQLNIPQSLSEYGIAEEMFLGNVDRISANAVLDACTGCNPRETGVKEFKTLYTAAFYGKKVSL